MRFSHKLQAVARKYRPAICWAVFSISIILYARLVVVPGNGRLGSENGRHELEAVTVNPNYHEVTVPKFSEEELAKKYKPKRKTAKPKWPNRWIRGVPSGSKEEQSPITCDMNSIVKNLRPDEPEKATKRKFRGLPDRYLAIHDPKSIAPTCGGEFLSPWKVLDAAKSSDTWMIFFVKSAPSYAENRKAVRETWGSTTSYKGNEIRIIFLIGRAADVSIQEKIRKESAAYGDILQCDIEDGYEALPTKVLSAFRWILMHDVKSVFYTVTDDDCLIDLPRMQDHFMEVATTKGYEKNLHCGYVYDEDSKPFRGGKKWSLTKELYSGERFPTFCHGALWTLSKPLLHAVYCVSELTNYEGFFLEDVLITGILREKLGFANANIQKTIDKRTDAKEDLFLYHAGHRSTAETAADTMIREWKRRQKQ